MKPGRTTIWATATSRAVAASGSAPSRRRAAPARTRTRESSRACPVVLSKTQWPAVTTCVASTIAPPQNCPWYGDAARPFGVGS